MASDHDDGHHRDASRGRPGPAQPGGPGVTRSVAIRPGGGAAVCGLMGAARCGQRAGPAESESIPAQDRDRPAGAASDSESESAPVRPSEPETLSAWNNLT